MTRLLRGVLIWFMAVALVLLGSGVQEGVALAKVPAVQERVKIVVGLPGGRAAHAQEILDRFHEEHPDVLVEPLVLDWGSFFEKLPLMLVSGVAPDVWYGEAGRALGWYEYGFIEDLRPYAERDLDLDHYFFLDAAKDPKTGAWAGIPSDFQVTSLFYNTEHFSASGLSEPDETWTYQTLVDAARKLTLPGADEPLRWGFNMQPEYITAGWMLWMKMLGGKILDETRSTSRLLEPQNQEALQTMMGMMYEQSVSPSPGLFGFVPWEAAVSFQEGRTSMMFHIYSWNRQLRNANMEAYDVALTPIGATGKRFTTAVPNVWMMNADSTEAKKEAAWKWIRFQIDEEAQRIRMAEGAGVPVNRGVARDFIEMPHLPDNRQIYLESYAFADTLEENAVWEEYRQAIEQEFRPMWAGEITPETALLNADQKVRQILEGVS